MKKLFKEILKKIFRIFTKFQNPIFFPLFYLTSHILNKIRVFLSKTERTNAKVINYKALNQNGFLIKENYLSLNDFTYLKNMCKEIEINPNNLDWEVRYKTKTSIQFLPKRKLNPVAISFVELIERDLSKIVGQSSEFADGFLDIQYGGADGNTDFHTDIYRPTYKCWLYLHDVEDFPLQIIKGTHKLGPINFLIHLSCQIKHFILSALVALKFRSTFPKDYSFGSWRIPEVPFFSNFLSKKVEMDTATLNVKANTLVIANTHSFHRRSPNGRQSMPRKSIHVQLRTPIF